MGIFIRLADGVIFVLNRAMLLVGLSSVWTAKLTLIFGFKELIY